MSLRNRMFELTEVSEVDEFLEKYPTSAFFKAGSCHKTMQGFGYVEQVLNPYEDLYMAFVRVIESRPVSNYIAQLTGVIHQSPQLILMVEKKPVYDVDNWNINVDVVQAALNKLFDKPQKEAGSSNSKSGQIDVGPYTDLLKQFIDEKLSEAEFENHWLMTFQMDATPRSTEQFDLLNSLFGDVDQAIANKFSQSSLSEKMQFANREQPLRKRAEQLYSLLKTK